MYTKKYLFYTTIIGIHLSFLSMKTALAQPLPHGHDSAEIVPHPWHKDVSPEAQEKAQELFQKGNASLDSLSFAKAAALYREALRHWNHPAIQYNLMIALIHLDQPVAAYRAVLEALRHGAAPLERAQYRQALDYKKLLGKQISWLEIASSQPGVIVKLDGKPVLSGPGSVTQCVLAGEHEVVASKRDHLTITHTLDLAPGKKQRVQLRLFTPKDLSVTRRNWKSWQPWALAGSGAVLALAGGALHWRASQNIAAFDLALMNDCPEGCSDTWPNSPYSMLQRGELQQRAAVGAYIAGGALMVTGLLLAYRPSTFMLSRDADSVQITLMPSVASGNAGVTAAATF